MSFDMDTTTPTDCVVTFSKHLSVPDNIALNCRTLFDDFGSYAEYVSRNCSGFTLKFDGGVITFGDGAEVFTAQWNPFRAEFHIGREVFFLVVPIRYAARFLSTWNIFSDPAGSVSSEVGASKFEVPTIPNFSFGPPLVPPTLSPFIAPVTFGFDNAKFSFGTPGPVSSPPVFSTTYPKPSSLVQPDPVVPQKVEVASPPVEQPAVEKKEKKEVVENDRPMWQRKGGVADNAAAEKPSTTITTTTSTVPAPVIPKSEPAEVKSSASKNTPSQSLKPKAKPKAKSHAKVKPKVSPKSEPRTNQPVKKKKADKRERKSRENRPRDPPGPKSPGGGNGGGGGGPNGLGGGAGSPANPPNPGSAVPAPVGLGSVPLPALPQNYKLVLKTLKKIPVFDYGRGAHELIPEGFLTGPKATHVHPRCRTERMVMQYSLAARWFASQSTQSPFYWVAVPESTTSFMSYATEFLRKFYSDVPDFATVNPTIIGVPGHKLIVVDKLEPGISWGYVATCPGSFVLQRPLLGEAGVKHGGELQFIRTNIPNCEIRVLAKNAERSFGDFDENRQEFLLYGKTYPTYSVRVEGQGVYCELEDFPNIFRSIIEEHCEGYTLVMKEAPLEMGDYGLYQVKAEGLVPNPPFPPLSPQLKKVRVADVSPWILNLFGEKSLDWLSIASHRDRFVLDVTVNPADSIVGESYVNTTINVEIMKTEFMEFWNLSRVIKNRVVIDSRVFLAEECASMARETNSGCERSGAQTGSFATMLNVFKTGLWGGCCGARTVGRG